MSDPKDMTIGEQRLWDRAVEAITVTYLRGDIYLGKRTNYITIADDSARLADALVVERRKRAKP